MCDSYTFFLFIQFNDKWPFFNGWKYICVTFWFIFSHISHPSSSLSFSFCKIHTMHFHPWRFVHLMNKNELGLHARRRWKKKLSGSLSGVESAIEGWKDWISDLTSWCQTLTLAKRKGKSEREQRANELMDEIAFLRQKGKKFLPHNWCQDVPLIARFILPFTPMLTSDLFLFLHLSLSPSLYFLPSCVANECQCVTLSMLWITFDLTSTSVSARRASLVQTVLFSMILFILCPNIRSCFWSQQVTYMAPHLDSCTLFAWSNTQSLPGRGERKTVHTKDLMAGTVKAVSCNSIPVMEFVLSLPSPR